MDNKKILTEMLRKIEVQIDNNKVFLLNENTEKIEINCNQNGISDFKMITRHK